MRLAGPESASRLRLQLSEAQPIEGWLRGVQEEVGLEIRGAAYGLSDCMLAEQTVAEVRWPEGTRVRYGPAGWTMVAFTVKGLDAAKRCDGPIVIGAER